MAADTAGADEAMLEGAAAFVDTTAISIFALLTTGDGVVAADAFDGEGT